MSDFENTNNRPRHRVDLQLVAYAVYILVVLVAVNLAGLYYLYHTLVTPPAPLDKQVESLVRQSDALWQMKQNIKATVK